MESHDADFQKREDEENASIRELEFFNDDTENHFKEIEDRIKIIKEISKSYDNDFCDEIKQRIMDLL